MKEPTKDNYFNKHVEKTTLHTGGIQIKALTTLPMTISRLLFEIQNLKHNSFVDKITN